MYHQPINIYVNGMHSGDGHGLGAGKPSIGLGAGKPTIGLGAGKPGVGLGAGKPTIGLGVCFINLLYLCA